MTVVTSGMPASEPTAQVEPPLNSSISSRFKREDYSSRLSVMRLETSKLRFWGTWRYMRNLRRWFEKNPVDLAYVSMLKHDAYSVLTAGEHLGFPVVLRPEGAGATGDIAWQSWGNFGRMIGRRCRDATAFVTISIPIEHELREAWCSGTMRPSRWASGLQQTPAEPRIEPIPNGVPVPDIPWQRRSDWRAAPRAMFVGRLASEKGLDTLIDAWPHVLSRYSQARLILIGEGPLRLMLEERVKRLGMTLGPGQTVELPGVTTDPTETLREADLFVLPSREEGMSIALLEAMALGIPLVASSIPGNRQIVDDFKHGRLSPSDKPEALARVIIDQWDNFDRAFHMSRAARSRIDQEFSIRSVARKHLTLFEDILGNRRSS